MADGWSRKMNFLQQLYIFFDLTPLVLLASDIIERMLTRRLNSSSIFLNSGNVRKSMLGALEVVEQSASRNVDSGEPLCTCALVDLLVCLKLPVPLSTPRDLSFLVDDLDLLLILLDWLSLPIFSWITPF